MRKILVRGLCMVFTVLNFVLIHCVTLVFHNFLIDTLMAILIGLMTGQAIVGTIWAATQLHIMVGIFKS